MSSRPSPVTHGVDHVRAHLTEFAVIDVRSPGEYAGGHLPTALNIPLDRLDSALPELRHASGRGGVLVVCASGARSETASRLLNGHGIPAAGLRGGTSAWAAAGHELHRSPAHRSRGAWSMERQVRLGAGLLVLLGLALGVLVHPAFQLVSAGVAGGLVFSALTDTCGMAVVLGKLPHNRPKAAGLEAVLTSLRAL
ncbi:rhodanese-like domain-containing protein [Streptomyces griseoluteus]|uniref:rhodanese-like domain-containing protein n=1 Tax=Streptomyces griseoluteus TaxID=29306 RepID=UPI0037F3D3E5